jgi:hypothetical protein
MHFIKFVLTSGIAIYASGIVANGEGSINVCQNLSDSILFYFLQLHSRRSTAICISFQMMRTV